MFADCLKSLRKARKINQTSLADTFGVSQATIASWEAGRRQPDFETLLKIADFFQVSTDYLLGRMPMTVEVKKESPPPIGDDEMQLTFKLDEAPQDINELESMVRNLIKTEVEAEFTKRGL